MKTQFDFQGTALKDFKASKLRDRNFYEVSIFEGVIYKHAQGKFYYYGFQEYAVFNSTFDQNAGTIITDQQPATPPGPGYVKYLTETISISRAVIPSGGFGGADYPACSYLKTTIVDRITGEVKIAAENYTPDLDTFNDWPGNIGASNEHSNRTSDVIDGLDLAYNPIEQRVKSLSNPWPIESAAGEAINLMNSIEGTPLPIRAMEWGAQAKAMYNGQSPLNNPALGSTEIITERRTSAEVADGNPVVEGGSGAVFICEIEGGNPIIFLASRTMVKCSSPVCVTYKFEEEVQENFFARPVFPFVGGRHKRTELFIECVALAVDKFLPQYVARRAGNFLYLRFNDPPAPSTEHLAPDVCYPPVP